MDLDAQRMYLKIENIFFLSISLTHKVKWFFL